MADDHRGSRGYSQRNSMEGSSYPPPPEDENDRRSQYPPPPVGTSSSMSLPSMSYYPPPPGAYQSDPRYPDPRYPSDQRYSADQRPWGSEPSSTTNGYPPPPTERSYPPPPGAPIDRRPYDDRSRQYEDPRPPYDDRRGVYDRPYPDPYYGSQPEAQSRMQQPYTYSYQPPPQGYHHYAPQSQLAPPQPQAAPRQRTSIACRYCRKRKIRCSGYANTPNGKCTNCDKLRIDCVFQPVSSNSSTAFVPVSAVPGGVPAGTTLYGAYGQPLGPASGQSSSAAPPYPPTSSDYPPPAYSPTASQHPPLEDRDRDPGRRRTRPPEEGHSIRLPPPNHPKDDDPRRRSPSSNHSNGTPPTAYYSYQPSVYDQGQPEPSHRTSPSGPPPPGPAPPPPSMPTSNPMSLNHLIGSSETGDSGTARDVDRDMLRKLNRRS